MAGMAKDSKDALRPVGVQYTQQMELKRVDIGISEAEFNSVKGFVLDTPRHFYTKFPTPISHPSYTAGVVTRRMVQDGGLAVDNIAASFYNPSAHETAKDTLRLANSRRLGWDVQYNSFLKMYQIGFSPNTKPQSTWDIIVPASLLQHQKPSEEQL